MGTAIVRATISSVQVRFNGDLDDASTRQKIRDQIAKKEAKVSKTVEEIKSALKDGHHEQVTQKQKDIKKLKSEISRLKPEKDNTIVAKFNYPRSGHSSISALLPVDLKSGEPLDLGKDESFLSRGLFKEEVQEETQLQISITDRDRRSKLWSFVREILAGIFEVYADTGLDYVSNLVVYGTASTLASEAEGKIEGSSDDKITTIAKSSKVKIEIGDDGQIRVLNPKKNEIEFKDGLLKLALKAPEQMLISREKTNGQVKLVTLPEGGPNGEIVLRLESKPR